MLRQFCNDEGCYRMVDKEDLVVMADGSYHPVSLKCYDCQTDEDRKRLKNYKKAQRKKANKKLKTLSFHSKGE